MAMIYLEEHKDDFRKYLDNFKAKKPDEYEAELNRLISFHVKIIANLEVKLGCYNYMESLFMIEEMYDRKGVPIPEDTMMIHEGRIQMAQMDIEHGGITTTSKKINKKATVERVEIHDKKLSGFSGKRPSVQP